MAHGTALRTRGTPLQDPLITRGGGAAGVDAERALGGGRAGLAGWGRPREMLP